MRFSWDSAAKNSFRGGGTQFFLKKWTRWKKFNLSEFF